MFEIVLGAFLYSDWQKFHLSRLKSVFLTIIRSEAYNYKLRCSSSACGPLKHELPKFWLKIVQEN